MQRTDNFNLIVVEGTDTVNLLTQMNPNTEAIDGQMFKNQNAGVQTATELLSGTVHAITRSVPDASMIRFTAVSRFTAGDTFTVDGVQVSALLPSGEQLPDGAFIIGSEVLCVLKGTLLTVFASGGAVALAKNAEKLGGNLPSYYATKEEVDTAQNTANSAGNLAEVNRQNILELENKIISNYSYTKVNDKLAYIKNGKERILDCIGCTFAEAQSVDISDSLPSIQFRNVLGCGNQFFLANVWVNADGTINGNYRSSYGATSPSVLSSNTLLFGQIRWFSAN